MLLSMSQRLIERGVRSLQLSQHLVKAPQLLMLMVAARLFKLLHLGGRILRPDRSPLHILRLGVKGRRAAFDRQRGGVDPSSGEANLNRLETAPIRRRRGARCEGGGRRCLLNSYIAPIGRCQRRCKLVYERS